MTAAGPDWPGRVALVGGGMMGGGFAHIFGLGGIPVTMTDASPEAAERSVSAMLEAATAYEEQGLFVAGSVERLRGIVSPAASIAEAVADADFVLEAVTEDPEVKQAVFAEVSRAAREDAVIASNTSAIPITQLSGYVDRPERFLGTHWFNPPQFIPCVELIPGPATDPDVVERMHALHTRLGKRPVVVGDGPGFIANRIQFAMYKEAVSVVADGLATPEAVDEVVSGSFGFRLSVLGPFAIGDMAGLDVYVGAYGALEEGLGERMAAPAEVTKLVAEGRTGAKSGGGFMDWPDDRLKAAIADRDARYAQLLREVTKNDGEK